MHVASINNGFSIQEIQEQARRKAFKDMLQPAIDELDRYDIPEDKIQRVIDYTVDVAMHNPQMKPLRIARKTVEYFKLKLKEDGTSD